MSTTDSTAYGDDVPTPPTDVSTSGAKSPIAKGLIVAMAVLVVAALVAIALTVIGGGTADAQVTLRTLGSSGDDPFGPSIAPPHRPH